MTKSKLKVTLNYAITDIEGRVIYHTSVDVFIYMSKDFEKWPYDKQEELMNKMYPNADYIPRWEFTDDKFTDYNIRK